MRKFIFSVIALISGGLLAKSFSNFTSNSVVLEKNPADSIYYGHHSHSSHASYYSAICRDSLGNITGIKKDADAIKLEAMLSAPSKFLSQLNDYFVTEDKKVLYATTLPAQEVNVKKYPQKGTIFIITVCQDSSNIIEQFYIPIFDKNSPLLKFETTTEVFTNQSGRSPRFLKPCILSNDCILFIRSELLFLRF